MTSLLSTWWPILAGLAVVALVLMIRYRTHVRYAIRVARAVVNDKRLPKPLRWAIRVGLVVKCFPLDFGADELILGTCGIILFTCYRKQLAQIVSEVQR